MVKMKLKLVQDEQGIVHVIGYAKGKKAKHYEKHLQNKILETIELITGCELIRNDKDHG